MILYFIYTYNINYFNEILINLHKTKSFFFIFVLQFNLNIFSQINYENL